MALHGWLILDKPLEISSAQAVGAVKRLLKPTKIGHGGTLDPLASGILPLALGEATKTFDYVVSHEKEYEFTVEWGTSTTTDDREGGAVNRCDHRPTEAEIRAILPEFTGIIMQRPPVFSAISQGGQRAYAMARAGQEVVLEPRPVEVMSLQIMMHQPQQTKFKITCGKGTYIRSIARDMGERLGCFGHVAALRRTRVGRFDEKSAISLDGLRELAYKPASALPLLAIEKVLDDILAVSLNPLQSQRLCQGQRVEPEILPPSAKEGSILRCHAAEGGKLLAMGRVEAGNIKPVRVFNL